MEEKIKQEVLEELKKRFWDEKEKAWWCEKHQQERECEGGIEDHIKINHSREMLDLAIQKTIEWKNKELKEETAEEIFAEIDEMFRKGFIGGCPYWLKEKILELKKNWVKK